MNAPVPHGAMGAGHFPGHPDTSLLVAMFACARLRIFLLLQLTVLHAKQQHLLLCLLLAHSCLPICICQWMHAKLSFYGTTNLFICDRSLGSESYAGHYGFNDGPSQGMGSYP